MLGRFDVLKHQQGNYLVVWNLKWLMEQPQFRWLIPATVIIPALVLLAASLVNRVEVIRAGEAALQRDLGMLREHALKVFETQELLLGELAGRVQRPGGGPDWDALSVDRDLQLDMAVKVERYDQVDSLALVDETGTARLASRIFPIPPLSTTDRDYWQTVKDGATIFISRSYPSKLTGKPHFSLVRRLEGPGGTFTGIAVASLEPRYFHAFWQAVLNQPGMTVRLVRADGAELARWPADEDAADVYPVAPLVELQQSGEALIRTARTMDGAERLVLADSLGPYPVMIKLDRPMAEILAPWHRNVMTYTAAALSASLILLLLSVKAATATGRERQALQSLRMEADRRADTARALRESEARYRGFFENAPQPQWVLTATPEGFQFEALNPTAMEALQVGSGHTPGRRVEEVLPPTTATIMLKRFEECRRLGQPLLLEETVDMPAGQRTYEAVLVPLRDDQGNVTTILGSARDVTERRQAEQRLVQAQKMETVGLLTGGVAHDFNNLLTAVINNLEIARDRPGDAANTERLDQALKAAAAGAGLVRRLLAFARRQPLEPRAVAVDHLLEEASTLIRRAVGERVEVVLENATGLPPVLIDPVQLENALLNLAMNARDAMPDGGRLTITTRLERAQLDRNVVGERVVLSVSDTGTGMPPDVAARVFEPFYTTKPQGQGTGLGLSTVYGFVEQSGGELRLETSPGKGTRFDLAFPSRRDLSVAVAAAVEVPEPATAPARTATVLLVEDEVLVRLSTADLLRDMGLEVLEAGSAEQALELLEARNTPGIDLMLTDIGLPGMDGRTLAARVASTWPEMPVILMSGYDRTASMPRSGGPEPANHYHLDKPYRPKRLRRMLAEALEGRKAA